jgi:futalosine hydrolase
MKILVVAATEPEVQGLKEILSADQLSKIDFLITGVGMINTTFELTKALLSTTYNYVINIGIAGSFDRTLNLGEVVWVRRELFSEMGAEDGDEFLSLIQLGLQAHDEYPFEWGELKVPALAELNTLAQLKQVRSITVNKVHGNEASILKTNMLFSPQIESMEGGAVFFVCMKMKVNCIQIRSISNYVERRNREAWKIKEALENLTKNSALLLSEILGTN